MARSNRTGVSRAVPKQAPPPPTRPSIPASTVPRAGAAPPPPASAPHAHPAPHATPMHSAPPPAMAPPAQAPAMAGGGGGGMLSGIMGTVVQGMAFGTGSAVANRAVDSIMGPRQVEHVHANAAAAPAAPAASQPQVCISETQSFQDCVKNAGGDVTPCQFYMDMLTSCRKNFPSA